MSVVTNALNGLDGNTDDYSCERCNETFTRRKYLKRHLETCQASADEETPLKQKGHPCIKCDKQFLRSGHLLRHIRGVHEGVKFPCNMCKYEATQLENLKRHKKLHH